MRALPVGVPVSSVTPVTLGEMSSRMTTRDCLFVSSHVWTAGSRNTRHRIAYTLTRRSASGTAQNHRTVLVSLTYMSATNAHPRTNSPMVKLYHLATLPDPSTGTAAVAPFVCSVSRM